MTTTLWYPHLGGSLRIGDVLNIYDSQSKKPEWVRVMAINGDTVTIEQIKAPSWWVRWLVRLRILKKTL